MSNFFDLSDGKSAATGDKEFKMGGGEPIPDKTDVEAICEAAKWDDFEGVEKIKLTWSILKPSEYEGRKIFHNVKVCDPDTKKVDKAKRMLAAIDANAKGLLAKCEGKPTDEDLERALVNRPPMLLKLGVYDINKDGANVGNWVMAVSPRQSGAPKAPLTDNQIDI